MKFISFENITFGYRKNDPIFKDLSFKISGSDSGRGHVIALMGASGTGKSTLFKLILQTEKIQNGAISFDKKEPVIAYLPQEPVLFEHLSPKQNARYFERSSYFKKRFNESLYNELIHSLNIDDVLKETRSVLEMSGGQRQRLSLLRALSIQPDFLLLDEPTTGLDAEVKLLFLNKLREIVHEYNLLVIYVTHHKVETELIADQIVFISRRNTFSSPAEIYQNDILNFLKRPPLLEAFKVFAYPKPNIVRGFFNNDAFIPAEISNGTQIDSIGITEENIKFSEDGVSFEIIASTAINTIIKFENCNERIVMDTHKIMNNEGKKINIFGTFNVYDLNGIYKDTITIKK